MNLLLDIQNPANWTFRESSIYEPPYKDFIKDEALSHARQELGLYKKRKKIEALGYEYNEEALAAGEYDELLIEE